MWDTCRGMRALRELAQRRHMRVSICTSGVRKQMKRSRCCALWRPERLLLSSSSSTREHARYAGDAQILEAIPVLLHVASYSNDGAGRSVVKNVPRYCG